MSIEPDALELEDATGEFRDGALRILTTGVGRRARAFVSGIDIDASSYPYAEVEADGPLRLEVFFLWKTDAEPGRIHGLSIPRALGSTTTFHLGAQPQWSGRVEGVGIGWTGPIDKPLVIRSLTLRPSSARQSLKALRDAWTAFEGLSGHSMNFVIGSSMLTRPEARPVPVLGTGVLFACFLYGLGCWRRNRRPSGRILAGVALAGWLVADALWQVDLSRQLELTGARYAGKSWHEKRLEAEDGALFRFTLELKEVLPDEPRVVFLVSRDPEGADRYLVLRTRYHLLPHNVNANYWHPPGPSEIDSGQYILVFEPRKDLAYDGKAGVLRWEIERNGKRHLEVEPVMSGSFGTLYRKR